MTRRQVQVELGKELPNKKKGRKKGRLKETDGEVEGNDSVDQEEVRGGVKKKNGEEEERASAREIAHIPSLTVFITGPDRGV